MRQAASKPSPAGGWKRHDLLEAEIVDALEDGIINEDEMRKITQIQDELGMSEEHTKAMIELLRDRHQSR